MKTSIFSLVSAAMFALTLGFASDANAQGISINIGGGRSIDIRDPFIGGGQPSRRPVNPVIDDQQSGSFILNPNTGRWEIKRQRDTTHASALDRNRNVVDPGSLRKMSSVALDAQGNQIETTVTSWTSFGVPHSNSTTRRIQQGNNGRVIDERNVMRSTNPTAEQRPALQAAPQNDDGIPGFDE